ncbi:TPA: hypothetical protein DIC40_02160 [Patescibacteria group bacterium]|nr:hypothetical protein [Candidatus Gracilibacteria bacterium]
MLLAIGSPGTVGGCLACLIGSDMEKYLMRALLATRPFWLLFGAMLKSNIEKLILTYYYNLQ